MTLSATIDLPLFAWSFAMTNVGARLRKHRREIKRCRDCGVVINRSSRGRCKRCAVVGLRRDCPADFLAILRSLGSQGAARHYHASLATVTRWRRELEIRPQTRMKRGIGQSRTDRGFTARPLIAHRDMSRAGCAAEFLRRWGSVYRCTADGAPNAKGQFWKRNHTVLTDDQIIARATKLGWISEIPQDRLPDDRNYIPLAEVCRVGGEVSREAICALIEQGRLEVKLAGPGWFANLGRGDERIVAKHLGELLMLRSDFDATVELIAKGWEAPRPFLEALRRGFWGNVDIRGVAKW
ncbi:hypothetical protein AQZ52_11005 [Novosphingobium fuchskuhlense]|uniref:Uncharacterized protein n=1 Tax=Novosphingobium fuchskuhlense TaxID=1117702 RepID=A0A117UUP2_9SPHN|nr:hypothetical protein [Novosphingobium fuchskuhlense]KUR71191.1 hypothetical protein AQZ52_11005 [Novosphingobium fuchskuhlense]